MVPLLYSVNVSSIAQLEEKQSRFIAHLVPIVEFDKTLDELKLAHPKASHHVTAFRMIADNNQINESAKDDGEPAGTSGMPVLKTLMGANLINVGMIVTRYFGGTKLGTGGLARAYAGASNLAIAQADIQVWKRIVKHEFSTSFANSSEIERTIKNLELVVLDRIFNEAGVFFVVEGAQDSVEEFKTKLV